MIKILHILYGYFKLLHAEIKPFDSKLEALYQSDLREQFFEQIKLAIILGTLTHFLFIIRDFTHLDIAPYGWVQRFPSLVIGYLGWHYLDVKHEFAKQKIFDIGFYLVIVATFFLLVTLISTDNADYFIRLYPAFLLIFAYMYGALLIPLKPGFIFCITITISLLDMFRH